MKKILIIRFSSIGDIVLTSPIIRCVKNQLKCELHYLTKLEYKSILSHNPYIDRLIFFDSNLKFIINKLKQEEYDFIIDLHNNLRSFWIRLNLQTPYYYVRKKNIEKLLLIHFGFNLLNDHVVDRYFVTLNKLNVFNDHRGLDYFLPSSLQVEFDLNQPFIAWSIGATYEQKRLSAHQIVSVCDKISIPVLLIGGVNEHNTGQCILEETTSNNVYNFCGQLSLDQSAYIIKKSILVLTNDTGMMHIASAFQKTIISFWGCTKPLLGFAPYKSNPKSSEIISNPSYRPCSKHGNYCKFTKQGCIKYINPVVIENKINNVLK